MDKSNYKVLDDKIRNIETQLRPILSSPRNSINSKANQLAVQNIHHNLDYITKLIVTKMKNLSTKPRPLTDIATRVILLQKATRAWMSSPSSSADVAGFKVYENPEFFGSDDEGYDGDYEDGDVEKIKVIRSQNGCYKIVFWGMILVIGIYSFLSGFTDQRASATFLTPT